MKIHFTWTISPNPVMELESKFLIFSARGIETHFTITVHNSEYGLVSKELRRIAEVIPYDSDPDFLYPWMAAPKWNIEPKGDVVIGVDADVLVWSKKKLLDYAEDCVASNTIYGTITYDTPLTKDEWSQLFSSYGMHDEFAYKCFNGKECPYYINNGAVMVPSNLLNEFKHHFYPWLLKTNRHYKNSFFMTQIATTMALKAGNLPVRAVDTTFMGGYVNLEEDNTDACGIFHYFQNKHEISGIDNSGIDNITSVALKDRLFNIAKNNLLGFISVL